MEIQKEKYATWRLHGVKGGQMLRATRHFEDGTRLVVPLWPSERATYEGIWPSDSELPSSPVVLTGVCLFDARWQIEFHKQGRNPPGRKSLALPMEREEAYKRLTRGQQASKIWVPVTLSAYHRQLIAWIIAQIEAIDPVQILLHLPVDEYHAYIEELEGVLGRIQPCVHEALDAFAARVRSHILAMLPSQYLDRLTFIRPMQYGAATVAQSYQMPYQAPELFGVPVDAPMIGVEDLPELRIAYEAKRETGRTIPVLCGIMTFPSPYFDKTIEDGAVKAIAVE